MKAPKRKPIRIDVKITDRGCIHLADDILQHLPCTRLKEMMRERNIPIPKNKREMLDRLSYWLRDNSPYITINLG